MRVDFDYHSENAVLAHRARSVFDIVDGDTGEPITKVWLVDEEAGLVVRPLRHPNGALAFDGATGHLVREEVRCKVRLVPKPGMEAKAAELRARYDAGRVGT